MTNDDSEKNEASAVLAAMLSIEKRLMDRMEAIEARITVVERSIQRVETKQNTSAGVRRIVPAVVRDASVTDSESEAQSVQGEATKRRGPENGLSRATRSLPSAVDVAGPSASLPPEDIRPSMSGTSMVAHIVARRAVSLDYEESHEFGSTESLPRVAKKLPEGPEAAPPQQTHGVGKSAGGEHLPILPRNAGGHPRSRFKPAPMGRQLHAPAKIRESPQRNPPSPPQAVHKRPRSHVQASDARPRKRVRLQPFVLVPPASSRWAIEDTQTAIQRWNDDHGTGLTDDGSESDDELGELSNLTELSSSDEEEDERKAAEALMPRDEEDEPLHPVPIGQGAEVGGRRGDHRAGPSDLSNDGSQDREVDFSVKQDPEDTDPLPSSPHEIAASHPQMQAVAPSSSARPRASSSTRQASQPEVKQQPTDDLPLARRRSTRGARIKASPGYSIGPDAARTRLDGVPAFPVNLDEVIRRATVNRRFMSFTFGGSPVALYPKISDITRQRKGGHSYHCMFPNPKLNPHAPKQPGEPGLICEVIDYLEWDGVIVKLLMKRANSVYQYLGDYNTTGAQPLSQLEFQALPQSSKSVWMKDLTSRKMYRDLRARITLRKQLQREPTAAESVNALASNAHQFPLEEEDILPEFIEGREWIKIWRMECVAYDEQFQRRLASEYPAYLARNRTKKESDDD